MVSLPLLRHPRPVAPLAFLLVLASSSVGSAEGAASGISPACSPPPGARIPDAIQRLRSATLRGKRAKDGLDHDEMVEFQELLREVRLLVEDDPSRGREVDLALLDLAGLEWAPRRNHSLDGTATLRKLAKLGRDALAKRLEAGPADGAAWLATEVLDRPQEHPLERRAAAADLLEDRHIPETRTPLLRAIRTGEEAVRRMALAALGGWRDPAVHAFFIDHVEESGFGFHALTEHLEKLDGELGRAVLDRLRALCGRLYVSDEWRDAARARFLVRHLDADRAVPILLEALAVWERRELEGTGSKRISHEILRELQRISGRSMGLSTDRWNAWWHAVRDGRILLPEEMEEGTGMVSRPEFFGLQPVTDKVIFVVDHSGSMRTHFGTDRHSRYEEAVDQLVRFVETSGPDTRFGAVLFDDEGTRWRSTLQEASPSTIQQVKRWLEKRRPDGGTQLFAGIREALRLDRNGEIDLSKVEVDTVIVLCDGATAEGRSWVDRWLRKNNEEAQIVFHCVQIGARGNGTLEALAEGTGGDFVRVAR